MAGWASGLAGWPRGGDERTDVRTYKISPFYRTLSPIGATALAAPMKTKEKVEQGKGTADHLMLLCFLLTPNVVSNANRNMHKRCLENQPYPKSRHRYNDALGLIQFVLKNCTFLTPNVVSNANQNLHKRRLNATRESTSSGEPSQVQ